MRTAVQADRTTPVQGTTPRWNWALSRLPALAVWLVVTLTLLTIPEAPPKNDVDGSLTGALSYAHQQGLQFGKDLIYTCGPLAFLTFPLFSPYAAGLRMGVDAAFSAIVAAGLCLLAWRLRRFGRFVLIGTCLWVTANIERPMDVMVDVGLLCWGLLCFLDTGSRLSLAVVAFTSLGAFVSLSKVSFFYEACLGIAIIGGALLLRGHRRLAVGMVGGFGAGILLEWVLSGQQLKHLARFVITWPEMIRGYGEALSWEGVPLIHHSGMLVASALMVLVAVQTSTAFKRGDLCVVGLRGLALVWVSFLVFAAWKHAYMRGDTFHVAYFLGFAPLVVLALESLDTGRDERVADARPFAGFWTRWFRGGLALVCYLVPLVLLQQFTFENCSVSLQQPIRVFAYHVRSLLAPGEYRRQMMEQLELNRREAQLPEFRQIIGQASVDFFGQKQEYVLFNDLNYHPRPVLQSYAACTARLAQFNEDFYLSKQAPEYVIFQFWPMDRKFPPLEDGRVLRDLLINYGFVAARPDMILLKSKSGEAPRLRLVREGSVARGQAIDLRNYGAANLWMEIELKPTWLGRVRKFLYQPPTVRIAAWGDPARKLICRQRAPAPMLAAGFVASPLLRRNEDVQDFLTGKGVTRPAAYSLELLSDQQRFWQEAIHYRIYQIENLVRSADAGLRLAEPN